MELYWLGSWAKVPRSLACSSKLSCSSWNVDDDDNDYNDDKDENCNKNIIYHLK